MIHDENDVLRDDELVIAREFLKLTKYACSHMQSGFPRRFTLMNDT